MYCPMCSLKMRSAVRHGVEIDFCPSCQGVWLDHGELDKILDHFTHYEEPGTGAYQPRGRRRAEFLDYDDDGYDRHQPLRRPHDDDDRESSRHYKKKSKWKRKKDFLEDLFDIFD